MTEFCVRMDEIFSTETPERDFEWYFADTLTKRLARGSKHLVPVDARLQREVDVRFETVNGRRPAVSTSGASSRLVILDACRNNSLARSMQRTAATCTVSGGSFAGLNEDLLEDYTLLLYAAVAGTTAPVGRRRNSPYIVDGATSAALNVPTFSDDAPSHPDHRVSSPRSRAAYIQQAVHFEELAKYSGACAGTPWVRRRTERTSRLSMN